MQHPEIDQRILLLMRHARSSWKKTDLADHDRPLKKRGLRDAPRMGRLLIEHGLVPEVIVTSSARRAVQTAEAVAEVCGLPPPLVESQLYHAGPEEWSAVLADFSDVGTLLAVGHNPGLEEFLFEQLGEEVPMPTAAVACLRFSPDATDAPQLLDVWRPKEL